MYDYLIATDEGLAQSSQEDQEEDQEENQKEDQKEDQEENQKEDRKEDQEENQKEDEELLEDVRESEKDESEELILDDSSQSEDEKESIPKDDYNASRGIDFESRNCCMVEHRCCWIDQLLHASICGELCTSYRSYSTCRSFGCGSWNLVISRYCIILYRTNIGD